MENYQFAVKIDIEQGCCRRRLKSFIQRKKQENIKNLRGKLHWKGDLEDMRADDK